VASIERTAYPRFKRFLSARELHVFYAPQPEEVAWAREQTRSDGHLLALMVQLKCFNRMGHFPGLDDVPDVVAAQIRRDLGLGEDVAAVYDSDRTRKSHRTLIRRRREVVSDMPAARAVAATAITEAAGRKNDPADLINVALEKLVEGSFELPAYSTLDTMAGNIREQVNSSIFAGGRRPCRPGEGDPVGRDAGDGWSGDQERVQPDEAGRAAAVVDELPPADRSPALGRQFRGLPVLVAEGGPVEDHRLRRGGRRCGRRGAG
jgi:hypothetical protein